MERMIRNSSIVLLLCASFSSTVSAESIMEAYDREAAVLYEETSDTDGLSVSEHGGTLDDYLQYAALNNPALKASFLRWKAELENIPQAVALPDPRFSYAYYITNVETRVGPQRHKLDFTQIVPWFGTRKLRGELSMANADMKWQEFQERKLKLYYDIRTAYYDLYLLSQSIQIIKENMVLLGSLEEVVRTRYSVGLSSHADLVQIQVELGKLEERVLSMEDMRPSVVARLNALMNRPTDTNVPWPESLPDEELIMPEDALIEHAINYNPSLSSLTIRCEREKRAGELAGKSFYPSFTLGVSWIEIGNTRMPGVDDSGRDPLMPMISLNVPIWRGAYNAAVQEAELNERAAEQALQDLTNTMVADLKMLLYRYRDAERKVSIYRDSLMPKAQQALSVARAGYESDSAGFSVLIDAQRTLLEFELARAQADVSRAAALAGIELLAGDIGQNIEGQ